MSQKTYCDICKKEIKHTGVAFEGTSGKISFAVKASIAGSESTDLCLGCTIRAINKEAQKKLKRPYTKPAKPVEQIHPNTLA